MTSHRVGKGTDLRYMIRRQLNQLLDSFDDFLIFQGLFLGLFAKLSIKDVSLDRVHLGLKHVVGT